MLLRLLKADLARGRAVAAVLVGLVTLAVALASASASLIIDTVSAADRLSERARVPDLVQMHTGEADSRAIAQWADSRADVEDHMVMRTLPVPRAQLSIGGAVQASSYLEPAFVTAPERIDLLLDENGDRVLPGPGQVYLPVHYKAAGLAQAGDTVTVDTGEWRIDLRVAGFLRDAQMNAAMVPSKRLVVNPEDFSSLDEHIGEVEYLIEFDLADGASAAAVSEQYKAAGLPSTGIAVTAAQIQLMNALSTMLIAAVALVVAGVLAAVAVLALRYTVLAALEADLPQVAVLKAIGAPPGGHPAPLLAQVRGHRLNGRLRRLRAVPSAGLVPAGADHRVPRHAADDGGGRRGARSRGGGLGGGGRRLRVVGPAPNGQDQCR